MQIFRKHTFFRVLWLVLALHILNCSVDVTDWQPDGVPEDLSVNDMESVIEILLEKGFNIENAIAEHDENDAENDCGNLAAKKDAGWFFEGEHIPSTKYSVSSSRSGACGYELSFFPEFCPDNVSPPPES